MYNLNINSQSVSQKLALQNKHHRSGHKLTKCHALNITDEQGKSSTNIYITCVNLTHQPRVNYC